MCTLYINICEIHTRCELILLFLNVHLLNSCLLYFYMLSLTYNKFTIAEFAQSKFALATYRLAKKHKILNLHPKIFAPT